MAIVNLRRLGIGCACALIFGCTKPETNSACERAKHELAEAMDQLEKSPEWTPDTRLQLRNQIYLIVGTLMTHCPPAQRSPWPE